MKFKPGIIIEHISGSSPYMIVDANESRYVLCGLDNRFPDETFAMDTQYMDKFYDNKTKI